MADTSETGTELSLEEAVYTHLYETQGASLAEIEAALNISRFQTVDTLRALIRKGFVTQRDRMYLIQEDVKL
jgi:predicted DNA-binding transcriptional regulator